MNPMLSTVLTLLSILGIVAGFCMWILGRILTDRKDKLTLDFKVERLNELYKQLKDEVKEDIDELKERTKHL